jgi:hypothetical protein
MADDKKMSAWVHRKSIEFKCCVSASRNHGSIWRQCFKHDVCPQILAKGNDFGKTEFSPRNVSKKWRQ